MVGGRPHDRLAAALAGVKRRHTDVAPAETQPLAGTGSASPQAQPGGHETDGDQDWAGVGDRAAVGG